MFLNKKGQTDPKWIIYVVIACVISVLILGLWSWFTQQALPTDPESYVRSWEEYGEYAFDWSGDDQPWRLLAIFFFPLIIYFTIFFAAICLVFAKGNLGGQGWDVVQKPFVVFSFAVAFMILPTPITFVLYQSLGGISIIVLLFSWATALGFIFILFNYMSKHFSLGDSGRRRDTRPWYQGREKKEKSDGDKLRREANGLIGQARKFIKDCEDVIEKKEKDKAVPYMTFLNKLGERIDNLINEIEGSELPDYEKFNYGRTLEPLTEQLKKLYESLDELKGKEEKNEKILNDLINVAKKTEGEINKIKKEELPEDLRKDAEKIEDLRKKLEQTENYEERVKIGIELQELLKSFTGKSEEGEKQVEKEEEKKGEVSEKSKRTRIEFYRQFRMVIAAAEDCDDDLKNFIHTVKTSEDIPVSKNLEEKANKLLDQNKKVINKCQEFGVLFHAKRSKAFENSLNNYYQAGNFLDMKNLLNETIDTTTEFATIFKKEAYEKSEKYPDKTYVEAYTPFYKEWFPKLTDAINKYHMRLIMLDKRLLKLFRELAKLQNLKIDENLI